jgi:acyl carrier protein
MTTVEKLKKILVEDLNLEGWTPGDIDGNAPLFGDGLGLDSLDAVELIVIVKKHFGIEILALDEGKAAFQSVHTQASNIEGRLKNG